MDVLESLALLTPLQKKLIGGLVIAIGGFWGGIKFSDVRITAQVGKYEIQIRELKDSVAAKDVEVQGHLVLKEEKMKQALAAKAEADQAHAQAADAEARYRRLVAQAQAEDKSLQPIPVRAVTVIDVAKACDEVIAKKDGEIKGLNAAYANVFDAKTAADLAIQGLQSNEVSLKKVVSINEQINSDLSKQLESQKKRKWLYLAGGIILGGVVDHAIKK